MTSTVEYTSPGQRFARAGLVTLIQEQVVRVATLRAQISSGQPVTGDLADELRELERLQDRLDL
ncbi:hypothetical protein C8N24_5419 [Solirubrobacter pauli]|uniref:Uncharacterized protein n=1 Tax=Solirubrobacter pauli TaxID=166793 RepID=A0A660L1U5_9ACTN|nr:hypothetical protein [Solirubrobacter pauli]RKQ87398.1 hypothetical protein C8N24_5419 [Solirubrobacter pauli]